MSIDLYLEGFEEWSHERLCEETAWGVIEQYNWIPTPMLVMWLTKLVDEIEPDETRKVSFKNRPTKIRKLV